MTCAPRLRDHVSRLEIYLAACDAMRLNAALLSPCFAILLHVDVVVGLEGMDGLVGKLNSVEAISGDVDQV